MLGLELVVLLGLAVLLASTASRHLRIAPPVVLLAGGVLLGFIPALRDVQLPPQMVLLLFLPALLYWESLTTSLREIRSNLRGIVLLSTVLVIATAAAVAAAAHTLGQMSRALATVAIVTAVLIVVRFAFLFASAYAIRALDRRPAQRQRRVSHRARVVSGLSGFRGAVSLAAALAVPATLDSGAPFPDRDVIVFVTGGVIVLTLLQGLVLPAVVRWARLPADTALDAERQLAITVATEEVLAYLPQLAEQLGTAPDATERLRQEYENNLLVAQALGNENHPALASEQDYAALHRAAIAHKRATVIRLRDERRIDDTVLRQLQVRLDLEEVRMNPTATE